MKKVKHSTNTEVFMTKEEAVEICKIGKGKECCAFIVSGFDGFECMRMNYPANSYLLARVESGFMHAKVLGGHKGCAWEGEGYKLNNEVKNDSR